MKLTKKLNLILGLLGCLCFGGGDWLMMYADPIFEGNLEWLTIGTAAIPQWRYNLAMLLAFTNGLMSESMIIWFLFVYLEIGRKYGSKDDC